MKKNALLLFALLSFHAFAQPRQSIWYISPNSDGVQDELAIPLRISEKRYVQSWTLRILNSDGAIVRSIGNKISLPEKMTISSFFKQLVTPKHGVDVPATVVWNGAMDNGQTAPDGTYSYYVEATDDNGNKSRTESYTVIVDTLAPKITLTQPQDKIFGEGDKSEFEIRQSGSKEDKWTAHIRATDGKIIKTYEWEGEPETFSWNGTDDSGNFVVDGVYSYEISSVDRAGNVSLPVSIQNIIYSAEKPVINIVIKGSKYFSPGTDSKQSTILFDVSIPEPSSSANRLTDWAIEICGANDDNSVLRKYDRNSLASSSAPPSVLEFDGKNYMGARLPDGLYHARVTAKYLNGFVAAPVYSPVFVLDTAKPAAQTSVSEKVFGGGDKTTVTVSQTTVPKEFAPAGSWTGTIYSAGDESRTAVRTYDLGEEPPASIVWDGFTDSGKLAADGEYVYELFTTDLAGNEARINSDRFTLDTSNAHLLLSVREPAFSPNGDKEKDVETFTAVVRTGIGGMESYAFYISAADGRVVKTENGTTVPSSLVWDGMTDGGVIAADGDYTATLKIISANGSDVSVTTQPFTLDTYAPYVSASMPWTVFSAEETSRQQTAIVNILNCTQENLWTATVFDIAESPVRHFTWNGAIKTNGASRFEWDGTDDAGNVLPDGEYSIVLASEDAAGNKFSSTIEKITLDCREVRVFLTREYDGISPNGDGFLENQTFTLRLIVPDGISNWQFDIRRDDGSVARSWKDDGTHRVPYTITWDGLDSAKRAGEGTFIGVFSASYAKGNELRSVSAPFVCTATPPVLSVSTTPEYFSPDNDGVDDDLFISLSGHTKASIETWSFAINDPYGKTFWHTEGHSSITEKITWDGLSNTQHDADGFAERVQSAVDYPWEFTVTDNLGMTSTASGIIPVDVLVIRDGDVLKMAVPSIIFRSDNADFNVESSPGKGDGVTAAQAANNERVLKRVAQILNKFRDYKVTVVGHANRTTENELEETQDNARLWGRALIPLSQERAQFVRNYLVRQGVSASRLSTKGMGGTEPVADWHDSDNRWKNRRVEFILQK